MMIRKEVEMIDNTNTATKEGLYDIRILNLRTLRKLNKESVDRGYNRNLYIKKFEKCLKEEMELRDDVVWTGLKTKVLLRPLLIHDFKGGIPCEPHIRCMINTGGILDSEPFVDVPMEMMDDLETVDAYQSKSEKTFTPKLVVDNT